MYFSTMGYTFLSSFSVGSTGFNAGFVGVAWVVIIFFFGACLYSMLDLSEVSF